MNRGSQAGSVSEDVERDDVSLINGVAYLSLCASGTVGTDQEPFYVGSSSGAIIARVIQSSIYRGSVKPASAKLQQSQTRRASDAGDGSEVCEADSLETTSVYPTKKHARMLFDFFFDRIHPRWPLLDRQLYEGLFEKQYIRGALSIAERGILHLIYAITARFLAVTKRPCGVDDEVNTRTKHCCESH